MSQDSLDEKLNDVFLGKVVRKDLLLQVKKGTNVPSFVLEFLLRVLFQVSFGFPFQQRNRTDNKIRRIGASGASRWNAK